MKPGRLYQGDLLDDQTPLERPRLPLHRHESEPYNTEAHRRENRMTAVLVVLICAAVLAVAEIAVWLSTN